MEENLLVLEMNLEYGLTIYLEKMLKKYLLVLVVLILHKLLLKYSR